MVFRGALYKEKYFFITSEKWIYILATSITFLLCGLWHGSQWTFIIWGGLHGFYLIFALFTKKRRLKFSKQIGLDKLPRFNTFLQILITFFLTTIGWIFFRANTVGQAVEYIEKLFGRSLLRSPMHITGMSKTLGFTAILLIVEWLQRNKKHGLELSFNNHFLKWIIYYATIAVILEFGANSQSFIYFQF